MQRKPRSARDASMPYADIRIVRMSRVRDPEDRATMGHYEELPLDMFTVIDKREGEVIFKGTTGPLVTELEESMKNGSIEPDEKIEFVYSTSGSGEATRVEALEFVEWADSVANLIRFARKMYNDEAEA